MVCGTRNRFTSQSHTHTHTHTHTLIHVCPSVSMTCGQDDVPMWPLSMMLWTSESHRIHFPYPPAPVTVPYPRHQTWDPLPPVLGPWTSDMGPLPQTWPALLVTSGGHHFVYLRTQTPELVLTSGGHGSTYSFVLGSVSNYVMRSSLSLLTPKHLHGLIFCWTTLDPPMVTESEFSTTGWKWLVMQPSIEHCFQPQMAGLFWEDISLITMTTTPM